jgi:hypothetical protein
MVTNIVFRIGLVQQFVRVDCDNQSVIFLAKNPTYHSKTKHIDIQYPFFRDMTQEKKVLLMKVDTLKNVIDSLTKYVRTEKFSWCRGSMGIESHTKRRVHTFQSSAHTRLSVRS